MVKATVFNIMKYSVHDGPGIRTAVFLKGCPLSCRWCHNPEGIDSEPQTAFYPNKCIKCGNCGKSCPSGAREVIGYVISLEDLICDIKKDLLFYEQSGGGVTFSGGEPLTQPDFVIAALERCREEYIHTAVDTSGYCDEDIILKVSKLAGIFLYDIKFFDEEKHIEYCGVSNKIILENLKAITECGTSSKAAKIIIRVPVIPGVNDDMREMENICGYIADLNISNILEVHLLPYHDIQADKYKRLGIEYKMPIVSCDGENIYNIKKLFEKHNFKVKIGG